jgi:ketosteroid isomerase-like protein
VVGDDALEIVGKTLASFDKSEDEWLATLSPELEWTTFEERTTSVGLDAARQARARWLEAWTHHTTTLEDIVGEGDDVVASVRVQGLGAVSGIEVDQLLHMHFKVRGGKVVYVYEHLDRGEALRQAGLLHLAGDS